MKQDQQKTTKSTSKELDLSSVEITLPSVATKREDRLEKYVTLIYGPPGIGKSTLASNFPKPVFLVTEKGQKGLSVYPVGIPDWLHMRAAVKALRMQKNDFQTIVIDTIDLAFKFCSDYICKKHHITHPSDESWGKGWEFLVDEFTRVIVALQNLDKGIVFISHAKDMEMKLRTITLTKTVPSLTGTGRKIILPFVDIAGYCTMDILDNLTEEETFRERRVILFGASEAYESKDRSGFLPKKTLLHFNNVAAYFPGTAKKLGIPLKVKKKKESTDGS